MKLGPRLAAVAAFVPYGARVADIGTDHAYLPAYLITRGISPRVIAGEVHAGPYKAACELVARLGLNEKIEVRRGDGLKIIVPGEVDTVVIAGMGATTMIDILTANPAVTGTLRRLVLQPMQGAGMLRRWLAENGFTIVAEDLVEEDGRIYEIIAAAPGKTEPVDPFLWEIGPQLWTQKHPLLRIHLENLIAQDRYIYCQMAASPRAVADPKYRALGERIARLEELRQCL